LAGYAVSAIDAYADALTLALCEQVSIVAYDNHGFKADGLLAALDEFDLNAFVGVVYGSGFEAQPELLNSIAERLPLIGNCAEVVKNVKNPLTFFAALQKQHIAYPAVSVALPNDIEDMVIKSIGGCGGGHIQNLDLATTTLDGTNYCQQKIEGDAVSLLFVADSLAIEPIGFNLQWLSASADAPYRYGGAAGNADFSSAVKSQLIKAANALTLAFGLRGLNSLDAIVRQNAGREQVYVLEINPRLSATLDLYTHAMPDVFEKHIQTCQGNALIQNQKKANTLSKAHAIVYADQDLSVNSDIEWPKWVKDNPSSYKQTVKIESGAPVCTVIAEAATAHAAKALAQARVIDIQQLLKQK
jgi:predicted ATP-grasp superfamily ATP-dependent carboligase